MSNSDLRQLGNLSAGNKEQNIFKIFAYLNTKKKFDSLELSNKVNVKSKTILSYLKEIQKAQYFSEKYQQRLSKPFSEQFFGNSVGNEREVALKCYDSWQKALRTINNYWRSNHVQLRQYLFENNPYISDETFYTRLEQSIFIFTMISK